MDGMSVDALRLDNQLCFPLYACAREVVRRYKPFLDALDLTYTQYVTMLVLWECPRLTSKEIGDRLHLDSGTLTPVLKRLDEKGLVTRARDMMDERNLVVALTDRGRALRDEAADIPARLGACLPLTGEEAEALRGLLRKLLDGMEA